MIRKRKKKQNIKKKLNLTSQQTELIMIGGRVVLP